MENFQERLENTLASTIGKLSIENAKLNLMLESANFNVQQLEGIKLALEEALNAMSKEKDELLAEVAQHNSSGSGGQTFIVEDIEKDLPRKVPKAKSKPDIL